MRSLGKFRVNHYRRTPPGGLVLREPNVRFVLTNIGGVVFRLRGRPGADKATAAVSYTALSGDIGIVFCSLLILYSFRTEYEYTVKKSVRF